MIISQDHHTAFKVHINLLISLILQVLLILRMSSINNNPVTDLHSKSFLINRNFLDQVPALDFHFLLSAQMLNDNIGHKFPVRVPFIVQSMHDREANLINCNFPVIRTKTDTVDLGPDADAPDPVISFAYRPKTDELLGPNRHVLITASQYKELAVRVKAK